MKTIVFHSYKGGVGRSLSLANLGIALCRLGKKVVMLDLDVDAPGLHLKFLGESKDDVSIVNQGYVDYLREYCRPSDVFTKVATRILNRPTEPNKIQRIAKLRSISIKIKDNLKIIPAGSGGVEYWWKLADRWFQELFSLSQIEISMTSGIALHTHRDFLTKELDIFDGLFDGGTDYLLVDCRSSREYSSVPLYYWADIVVSMFSANIEGLRGAVHTHQALLKARKTAERQPLVFPVVCRVPESFSEADTEAQRQKFLAYWKSLDPEGNLKVPEEPLSVLREYRSLETAERLVLPVSDGGATSDEIDVPLAHDYVTLFHRILASDEGVASALPTTDEKAWKVALGLAEDVRILESYFKRLADGELLNVDNKRNVAVRTDTLLSLMNSLRQFERENLEKLGYSATDIDDWILRSFHQAGYVIGRDFGQEAMEEGRVWPIIPEQVDARLDGWCKFDQLAGFGTLTHRYDPSARCGRNHLDNQFSAGEGHITTTRKGVRTGIRRRCAWRAVGR